MEPTMDKKSNGALIGAIIVIIILVLGGVYLWQSNSLSGNDMKPIPVNNQQSSLGELNEATVIETDLDAIEAENNATDASESASTTFTTDVSAVQ